MKDVIMRNISGILDKFVRQEVGNRLSEFAMITLRNMILMEISRFPDQEREDIQEKEDIVPSSEENQDEKQKEGFERR